MVTGLGIQSDGAIVASADVQSAFFARPFTGGLALVSPNGASYSLKLGLATDANHAERAGGLALQPDGKILVALCSHPDVNGEHPGAARFLPDGKPDPNFGSNGASYLASVHCYSENDVGFDGRGRIYLGGVNGQLAQPGRSADGSDSFFAARLLPSGSLDGSFGKGGVVLTKYHTPNNPYGEPAHLIVDARGRPVIAGTPGDHVALLRYTAGR